MRLTLRAGGRNDADPCGRICYQAFKAVSAQHNFPPDFPDPEAAIGLLSELLARRDIYSVVAEVDGRVVGSNFLWENAVIAGVGPVTAEPIAQNMAVGRHLMTDVMGRAQERRCAGIRLAQAAYHSRSLSLYSKLGFDAQEPLSILQGPAAGLVIPGHEVRPAKEADLGACNQLCRRVHGHDRGPELLDAIKQATANVVERQDRITGYATMVGFLGHAVGENNQPPMPGNCVRANNLRANRPMIAVRTIRTTPIAEACGMKPSCQ